MLRNAWLHFKTITYHKILVAQGCFRIGLYWQGLIHDLSKYSPVEFMVGVKYFQGMRSPNAAQRDDIGFSPAWLHHKGRNKHHYEYWIDYKRGDVVTCPMPKRYLAEMLMDRIAACKVYRGKNYTDASPIDYYRNSTNDSTLMHETTKEVLETYLEMLAEKGEKETFKIIKKELVKHNS